MRPISGRPTLRHNAPVPEDEKLPPILAEIADIVDRAAAISRAHPPGAPIDPALARYRTALEALRNHQDMVMRGSKGALITLDEHAREVSAEHMAASRELVASSAARTRLAE
jgi:hypothetical protein